MFFRGGSRPSWWKKGSLSSGVGALYRIEPGMDVDWLLSGLAKRRSVAIRRYMGFVAKGGASGFTFTNTQVSSMTWHIEPYPVFL